MGINRMVLYVGLTWLASVQGGRESLSPAVVVSSFKDDAKVRRAFHLQSLFGDEVMENGL